jgi:hypothetical protein
MTKLNYLKKAKIFLRKVVKQRTWLLYHDKSYLESDFVKTELKNISYALGNLKSSDKMQQYLSRKEAEIRYMIPARYIKWHSEFRELLQTNLT